jgi:hypothetical protein
VAEQTSVLAAVVDRREPTGSGASRGASAMLPAPELEASWELHHHTPDHYCMLPAPELPASWEPHRHTAADHYSDSHRLHQHQMRVQDYIRDNYRLQSREMVHHSWVHLSWE